MIHTSKQLKDKVRNISKGDNDVAKVLVNATRRTNDKMNQTLRRRADNRE